MRHAWIGLVMVLGCGKGSGSGGAVGAGSGTADVTYQTGVRVLERAEGIAAVVGTSSDGWTLVFDAHAAKLQGLKAGDIILIKGLVARKVLAVAAQPDGDIAALTQSATLGETLQHGKLELHAPIRFGKKSASLWQRATSLVEGTAYADAPAAGGPKAMTVKGEYEGWEATASATLGDGRVDLDIQATKSVGGFKALVTAKGYIENFDVSAQLSVNASVVDHVNLIARNINGKMDFKWEVGKESPGVETGKAMIKLPASLEVPLAEFLGGFPLFLDVSSAVLLEPAFTGGSEISKGAFHVSYNGTGGFDYKSGSTDPGDAKMDGDAGLDDMSAISPAAPVGMVVAFAAPRFELTFGVGKVFGDGEAAKNIKKAANAVDKIADDLIKGVFGADGLAKWKASPMGGFSLGGALDKALSSDATAWLEIETSTGMTASGAMAIVPCRKSNLNFAAVAGVGAQVLGQQVANKSTTLFKKEMSKIEPPNLKACQ